MTSQIDIITENIKRNQTLKLGGEKELTFIYGHHLILNKKENLPFHPNGMIFKAIFNDGTEKIQDYYSIGGGFVSIKDDVLVADKLKPSFYPCHKGADVLKYCEKLNLSVSDLVYKNEESWRTREEINAKALEIWESITDAIYRGVNKSGVLPGGLNVVRRATNLNKKLINNRTYKNKAEWFDLVKESEGGFENINKWVSCFAIAVNEENASFGRIVTAPTNGASGIIPAVLMYSQTFTIHVGINKIIRFLLTAGEIGTLFKKNATISAAMGGCQAETGVSSAMAAAGLTEIMDGTPGQVLMAAEIAMEHHLGLTCDPVGGLVQIPCIERNSMGAIKAITAANFAIENDPADARVTLDEVIQTMWETALSMNERFKETSEGGLAIAVNVAEC